MAPPTREYRHDQLPVPLEGVAVGLRVASERAIELESGAHRAGRGIGRCVELEVVVGDRGGVEDALVDDVLEVLPLAPGHQHLRHVADVVEAEVPHARVGQERIEDGRARDRRLHQDQMRKFVPVRLRICVGDHQPDVVADEGDGLLYLEMLAHEPVDVLSHGALVVAAFGPR